MPALFGTALSERSFSTRLGLWFQRMALVIARQFHQHAESNYLVVGGLQPATEAQVTAILSQMNTLPRRVPNREADTAQVLGLQYPGGTTRQVRSDLFILRNDGSELYFEMKTVKPNKGTFEEMKRNILMIMCMRHEEQAQAYAAMSYNPAGEGNVYIPEFNQYLEIGTDLLVGSQFWSAIGDESTYNELLEIAHQVGLETADLIGQVGEQAAQQ